MAVTVAVALGSQWSTAAAVPPPQQPPQAPQAQQPVASPSATDSESLQAEVDALRAALDRLEVDASRAVEEYNAARAALQSTTLEELRTQSDMALAREAAIDSRAAAERRVRALYRSGVGVDNPLVSLRGSDDMGDVAVAVRTTRALLADDQQVVAESQEAIEAGIALNAELIELRSARVQAQADAETHRRTVELSLQQTAQLLERTDAALVAAVERERRAADALALEIALAAAADAATSTGGVIGGEVIGGEVTSGVAATPAISATSPEIASFLDEAAANAPDPAIGRAVTAAASRLGLPYTWGATGPTTFDCSGLTQWSYRQAGVDIPRNSRAQFAGLTVTPVGSLAVGDLVFFSSDQTPGGIHHVGMYVGSGLMIHAPRTGDVVKVSPVGRTAVFGAVRPVPVGA